MTQSMLEREGLALLVRSHDWPRNNRPHGHEWSQAGHGDRLARVAGQQTICLTLFTASNYCGGCGNNGAVVVFWGEEASGAVAGMRVDEWAPVDALRSWEEAVRATSAPTATVREPAGDDAALVATLLRQDVLRNVKMLITERKHELFAEFRRLDDTFDLYLPVPVWVQACTRVLGKLPWGALLGDDPTQAVAAVTLHGEAPLVGYSIFLARHQISHANVMGQHAGLRKAITSRLFCSLLVDNQTLRETLLALDPNQDGQVSPPRCFPRMLLPSQATATGQSPRPGCGDIFGGGTVSAQGGGGRRPEQKRSTPTPQPRDAHVYCLPPTAAVLVADRSQSTSCTTCYRVSCRG